MKSYSALNIITIIYVTLIIVWLIARSIFFDQLWIVALPNTIAEYLFTPLPILLVISFWQRNWSSVVKLLISLGLFIVMFGGSDHLPVVAKLKLIPKSNR